MTVQLNITRILLAIALAYILFREMCGTGKSGPCPEIVKETIDTQRIYRQWASEWMKPKPDTIIIRQQAPKPNPDTIYQVSEVYIIEPVDTAAIVQDYQAQVVYHDTSAITDSTGMRYGTAHVYDTVSENRIQARQWRFDLALPYITKTVTVETPPINSLYLGVDGMFGRGAIGGSIDGTLLNKKGQIYTVGAGRFAGHEFIKVGTKQRLLFWK